MSALQTSTNGSDPVSKFESPDFVAVKLQRRTRANTADQAAGDQDFDVISN
jgi:hypothetical protein